MKEVVIEAGRTERNYWRDLWRYRELFQVLAWRDFAVRYRQTAVGVAWAVLRPVLTVSILTVIFHRVAGLASVGDAPYALMVLAGMLPWMFFSTAMSDAASSLVSNTSLVSKIYFPRMIVPTATVIVSIVDLLIGLVILAVLMVAYRYAPDWRILTLPALVLMAFLAALGPGLWITAVNVRYRDFRYVTPFIVQFGLYISPVGFAFDNIPESWRLLYSINPMVGVINGFRWAVLGGEAPLYPQSLIISAVMIAALLWVGVWQFRKLERSFADVI
ncbi:ABC transporter permease [Microbaculum marinum]|uniref:Transport permease protein n=1 Tax=Microbaculum marinum TaxID=1764581 RepID=A0AAW9RRG3_9HYPH